MKEEIELQEWERKWLDTRGGRCASDVGVDKKGKYVLMLTTSGESTPEYLPLSKYGV